MLNDARVLSADSRFDSVQGAIVAAPSGDIAFQLDAAKNFKGNAPDDDALLAGLSDGPARRQLMTLEYFDYLNRFAALETTLDARGQWSFQHPWLTTFIGDSQVESVVSTELGALDPAADLGQFGQVALSPIRRAAISSPLLQMPSDDLCYAFNLIRIPATEDTNEMNRLIDANEATYGRVKAAGGTLYPVSAFPLSRAKWRDHFGSAFGQLAAAKQEFDPGQILTPGYEIF
jgi:cytokinin dehydrogenase